MPYVGSALSGFSLLALLWWKPIWQMAQASSAEALLGYFVLVLMLMFGVFMVSGARQRFGALSFFPCFAAGVAASYGVGVWDLRVVAGALAAFVLTWLLVRS